MTYSSPNTTTYNPGLNCDECGGAGFVPIGMLNYRLMLSNVCPMCKGTGEAQTKEVNK